MKRLSALGAPLGGLTRHIMLFSKAHNPSFPELLGGQRWKTAAVVFKPLFIRNGTFSCITLVTLNKQLEHPNASFCQSKCSKVLLCSAQMPLRRARLHSGVTSAQTKPESGCEAFVYAPAA